MEALNAIDFHCIKKKSKAEVVPSRMCVHVATQYSSSNITEFKMLFT